MARPSGRLLFGLAGLPLVLFLSVPIGVVVAKGLDPYMVRHLSDAALMDALKLSLTTSLISTVIASVFGLPLAYLLARHDFPGRGLLQSLVDLPMTMPPVVAGLALLLTFGRMGFVGTWFEAAGFRIAFSTTAVVLAQVYMAAPFFVRSARAGFVAVPICLEEAAMGLGRPPLRVFWEVSLPIAAPAVLAGVVLAWARAMSEFGATIVFAGSLPGVTQTIPTAIVGAMETDLPLALSIATVSLALSFVALIGIRLITRESAA